MAQLVRLSDQFGTNAPGRRVGLGRQRTLRARFQKPVRLSDRFPKSVAGESAGAGHRP